MNEAPSLQPRTDQSAELSALMAAYERQHGPVQTQPIVKHDKRLPFVITSPGNAKAKPSRALRQLDHKRAEMNTVKKRKGAQRLDTITRMAAVGCTIEAMAAATGITRNSVMRYMRDHHIPRGPQIDLEA